MKRITTIIANVRNMKKPTQSLQRSEQIYNDRNKKEKAASIPAPRPYRPPSF